MVPVVLSMWVGGYFSLSLSSRAPCRAAQSVTTFFMRSYDSCWCSLPLALLISGQASRFTFRSAFSQARSRAGRSPLQLLVADRAGGNSRSSGCMPRVDAFITLSLGGEKRWADDWSSSHDARHGGAHSSARLSDDEEEQRSLLQRVVPGFFTSLGVTRVVLELLERSKVDARTRRVEVAVAAAGAAAIATTPLAWWRAAQQSIPRWSVRWAPHSRMLLLRHLAFRRAVSDPNATYAHFLYCREDNAWMEPLAPLAEVGRQHLCARARAQGVAFGTHIAAASAAAATPASSVAAPTAAPSVAEAHARGVVAVDAMCGWGSYSDKIYLADAAGAATLFGRSFDQHVAHLAAWVQLAMLPPNATQRLRPLPVAPVAVAWNDPMQTEYFLESVLRAAGIRVVPMAFHRTDVRRIAPTNGSADTAVAARQHANAVILGAVSETVCVPELYWRCRSRHVHMRGLSRCGRVHA